MNLSDIAILKIKIADYCCITSGIGKNEIINLMQNADLTEKNEKKHIKHNIKHKKLLSHIKMRLHTA